MQTILTEYWKLLDKMEDYLKDGVPRNHPEPPVLNLPRPRKTGSPEAGAEIPDTLEGVAADVGACALCGLSQGRTNAVPGEGAENPLVMIIGEGPGADEDRTGRPFVGPAGQYLDKWLSAIGLDRNTNCFIGNIVKCRPPGNRDPEPAESLACRSYLDRQIALLKPKAILTVGRISSQLLIGSSEGIGRLRGNTYAYRGIPLIPTYHPSGVLRNPDYRGAVWEDLRRLQALLDSRE